MGYRLIALDIDGTIRSPEYPISDRTRAVIASVMDTGAYVTLATGRMFQSAIRSSAGLNITAPMVSFQGAQVTDPATEEVLWHQPLAPHMTLEALDALATRGMGIMAYYEDRVYVDNMTPWMEAYGERNYVEVVRVDDLRELASQGLTRLVVVGSEEEIPLLVAELGSRFDSQLYVTRSLPHFCEILHPDGGKDKALNWLCRHLGVREEDTVAFGNGWNDVPMLRWASLGVAIGGAVPEVLEVADRIAPPIEEDGAAHMLEDLLDRGLIG